MNATAEQSLFRVLDGGLGTLLEERGHDVGSALWSARILLEQPEAVLAAHREYLTSGAEVLISASYQASFEGFALVGLDAVAAAETMAESVRLARRAAASRPDVLVAASVGPFGAHRADGSEYRGNYGLSQNELADWHRPRIEALAAGGPDLLAVETIPSAVEVAAVVDALRGTGQRAWISLTPSMGATRSGESLQEAFALADAAEEVVALGVNCCHPSEVLGAMESAARVSEKPFVAYPNSGEEWDGKNHRWTSQKHFPVELVAEWTQAGARFIGGCCRVGPSEVAAIAAARHTLYQTAS